MAFALALVLALAASTQAAHHCSVTVPANCKVDEATCAVTCTYANADQKVADGTMTLGYNSCAAPDADGAGTKVQGTFTASAKIDSKDAKAGDGKAVDIPDGKQDVPSADGANVWNLALAASANNQRVATVTLKIGQAAAITIATITFEDYRLANCIHADSFAYFYKEASFDKDNKREAIATNVATALAAAAAKLENDDAFKGLTAKVTAAAGNQGFKLMVEGRGSKAAADKAKALKASDAKDLFISYLAKDSAEAKAAAELTVSSEAPAAELYIGFEGADGLKDEIKKKFTAYIKDTLLADLKKVGKFATEQKDFVLTLTSQSIDAYYRFATDAQIKADDFKKEYLTPFVNTLTGDDKKAVEAAVTVASVAPTEAPAANNTSSSAATASVVVSVVAAILAAL